MEGLMAVKSHQQYVIFIVQIEKGKDQQVIWRISRNYADAYAGYKSLYKSDKYPDNKITEAACWAHTRRKFYEITLANPEAAIANQVLELLVNYTK